MPHQNLWLFARGDKGYFFLPTNVCMCMQYAYIVIIEKARHNDLRTLRNSVYFFYGSVHFKGRKKILKP